MQFQRSLRCRRVDRARTKLGRCCLSHLRANQGRLLPLLFTSLISISGLYSLKIRPVHSFDYTMKIRETPESLTIVILPNCSPWDGAACLPFAAQVPEGIPEEQLYVMQFWWDEPLRNFCPKMPISCNQFTGIWISDCPPEAGS